MRIVIARHAAHHKGRLTPRGQRQVEVLARALVSRGVKPTHVLTSEASHALRTAELLTERLGGTAQVAVVGALRAVAGNPGGFEDVVAAARLRGVDPAAHDDVVVVGHEGRISGLVVQLTGNRARPIPEGGAVAIEAASHLDLVKGRGQIDFRFPVVDHQEDALRPKVQSKMAVATFLAGFVFAALLQTVTTDRFDVARQAATVLLTLSLALFVCAVYIYDELGMPEGYWCRGSRTGIRGWLGKRREGRQEKRWARRASKGPRLSEDAAAKLDRARWLPDQADWNQAVADELELQPAQDGPLYTWMVRTWTWVFSPAVLLALAGFAVLLVDTGETWTALASLAAVLAALIWLVLFRPSLATD